MSLLGPGGIQGCFGASDTRLCRLDLPPDSGDRTLLGRQAVLGGLERQAVVAIVDARDHITSTDSLIVLDIEVGDVTDRVRREDGDVALHVGVVGAHEEAPVGPPIVAEVPAIGDGPEQHGREYDAFDGRTAARLAMANGGYGLRWPTGVRMRRWPCRSDDFRAFFHIHEAIPTRAH